MPSSPRPLKSSSEAAKQLESGDYLCSICLSPIRKRDQLWECRQGCYCILHLQCLRQWIAKKTIPASTLSDALIPSATSAPPPPPRHGPRTTAARVAAAAAPVEWDCPNCRKVYSSENGPPQHLCWCGRYKNLFLDKRLVSRLVNSCGEPCPRKQRSATCTHNCPLACHPGTCPPCPFSVERQCPCGKTIKVLACGKNYNVQPCGLICGKPLDCGRHHCSLTCHTGVCPPCPVVVECSCRCGDSLRQLPCAQSTPASVKCDRVCGIAFKCGKHKCSRVCCELHQLADKEPPVCPWDPGQSCSCCCGATQYTPQEAQRKTCEDPLPNCGKPCGLVKRCGHVCSATCHDTTGGCPADCAESKILLCRCGKEVLELPCQQYCRLLLAPTVEDCSGFENRQQCSGAFPRQQTIPEEFRGGRKLTLVGEELRCHRYCGDHMSCRRHRCREKCCPKKGLKGRGHVCPEMCTNVLPCGHTCDSVCHPEGACPPCGFIERPPLVCRNCGDLLSNVPVHCGDDVSCRRVCSRPMPRCSHRCPKPCGHEGACEPCPIMGQGLCAGGHMVLPYVRCSQRDQTPCGRLCGKTLPCGQHRCNFKCHPPPCPPCTQPCQVPRMTCEHTCGARCHHVELPREAATSPAAWRGNTTTALSAGCPGTPCKGKSTVTCACGRLKEERPCADVNDPSAANTRFVLRCNSECATAQRQAALEDAFGISKHTDAVPPPLVKVAFEAELVHWGMNKIPLLRHFETCMMDNNIPTSNAFPIRIRLKQCNKLDILWCKAYAAKYFRLALKVRAGGAHAYRFDCEAHRLDLIPPRLFQPTLAAFCANLPPSFPQPLPPQGAGLSKDGILYFAQRPPCVSINFSSAPEYIVAAALATVCEPWQIRYVAAHGPKLWAPAKCLSVTHILIETFDEAAARLILGRLKRDPTNFPDVEVLLRGEGHVTGSLPRLE